MYFSSKLSYKLKLNEIEKTYARFESLLRPLGDTVMQTKPICYHSDQKNPCLDNRSAEILTTKNSRQSPETLRWRCKSPNLVHQHIWISAWTVWLLLLRVASCLNFLKGTWVSFSIPGQLFELDAQGYSDVVPSGSSTSTPRNVAIYFSLFFSAFLLPLECTWCLRARVQGGGNPAARVNALIFRVQLQVRCSGQYMGLWYLWKGSVGI